MMGSAMIVETAAAAPATLHNATMVDVALGDPQNGVHELSISTVRRLLTPLDVKVAWSVDFDCEMSSHVTRRQSCVGCRFRP